MKSIQLRRIRIVMFIYFPKDYPYVLLLADCFGALKFSSEMPRNYNNSLVKIAVEF